MGKRGFQKISEKQFLKDFHQVQKCKTLYSQVKLPIRKTKNAAGYDFFSVTDNYINSKSSVIIPTGIKAYMEEDELLSIYIRSSLGFKSNVRLMNQVGIIDADYYNNKDNEGHIFIALENHGSKDVLIKKGEAFAQGVFSKYLISENDSATDIREGGVGSTNWRRTNE